MEGTKKQFDLERHSNNTPRITQRLEEQAPSPTLTNTMDESQIGALVKAFETRILSEAAEPIQVELVDDAELNGEEDIEMQFSMTDFHRKKLFIALARKHGLRPYRYPRQKHTCTATIRIPYPVASLENVTVSDRPKSVIYCLFSCRGYCRSGRRSRCERSDASAEPSTAGGIQPVTAPTFSTFSVPPRMRFRAMLRRHAPTRRCNVLNILS